MNNDLEKAIMRHMNDSRNLFRIVLSLVFALPVVSGAARAQDPPNPWCDCAQQSSDLCPPEGWWGENWEVIIEKWLECGDYYEVQDMDNWIHDLWEDWKENFNDCQDTWVVGLQFSNAVVDLGQNPNPSFQWDRDGDGNLTEEDFFKFIEDSRHCNSPGLQSPDYVPLFQPMPPDILVWLCYFLQNEGSGQQYPAPWAVAASAMMTYYPEHYGRYPTGEEIGTVMLCGGDPPFIPPGGPCPDYNGDGVIDYGDIGTAFAVADLNAGGDGSGSGLSDPVGMLTYLIDDCAGGMAVENPCNDVILWSGSLLDTMFPPEDVKEILDSVDCGDEDPPFDPFEELDMPEGEGNPDDDLIHVGLNAPSNKPTAPPSSNESEPETMEPEEDPCGPDAQNSDSGGGGDVVSETPISIPHGFKIEQATDVIIRLPGRDLKLTRSYNSKDDLYDNWAGQIKPGLVGVNWTMNVFRFLNVDNSPQTPLVSFCGPPFNRRVYWDLFLQDKWTPGGPATQSLHGNEQIVIPEDGGPTTHNVWKYDEPGEWTRYFYRQGGNTPAGYEGLLLQERDVYGNAFTYYYDDIGSSNTSPRLMTIAVNGFLVSDPNQQPEVIVQFGWNLSGDNLGRLSYIQVGRRQPNGSLHLTDEVHYTYKADGDGLSDDLGTHGDLVQVVRRKRVHQSPGDAVEWREQITQYRYHRSGYNPSFNDERLNVTGEDHQLKMVIKPQQIEYAAQYMNRNLSFAPKPVAHRQAAEALLKEADAYEWYDEQGYTYKVVDLASKIISYLSDSLRGKAVAWQYLQGGCGCTSQAHGVKQVYTYYDWNDGRTTAIKEYVGEDYDTLYRRIYYDLEKINNSPSYYLKQHAIVEIDEFGAEARTWVWHYEYDADDRNMVLKATPEAIDSYNPVQGGNPPTCTLRTDSGLIYTYEYDDRGEPDDNRLASIRVQEGANGAPAPLLLITYDDTHHHLPRQVDRFVTDATNPTEEEIESQWIDYGFHDVDNSTIAWMQVRVEAEKQSENGPSATSQDNYAVEIEPGRFGYERYELFDDRGRHRWTRAADHVLTKRDYQTGTGIVTSITENASKSQINTQEFANIDISGWIDRSATGDQLTTTMDRDAAGYLVQITSPDNVSTQMIREMRESDDRPGIYYYARTVLPPQVSSTTFDGPAQLTWYDAGGDIISQRAYTLTDGEYYAYGSSTFDLDAEIERSVVDHTLTGSASSVSAWHDIARNEFYTTSWTYDELGRVAARHDANGTSVFFTRDVMGRVIEQRVGTGEANAVLVSRAYFDAPDYQNPSQGVGNGHLSVVQQETGDNELASGTRTSYLYYDFRGHLYLVEMPTSPHAAFEYDHQGRVVERRLVSDPGDIEGSTLQYEDVSYSQRGGAFRSRIALDPQNLAAGYLESHSWFDADGRLIEAWEPGAPAVKVVYDELGRITVTYATDRGFDARPGASGNHADAMSVDGDIVFEQQEAIFQSDGRLSLETTRRRIHDTADRGALDGTNSVAMFTGYYYDDAGRIRRVADFGTNDDAFESGTTAPTIDPENWPIPGDQASPLRTVGVTYDVRGLISQITDPEGRISSTKFDDFGRPIVEIENDLGNTTVSWNQSESRWEISNLANDANRATSFYYDAMDNIVKSIAHLPGGSPDLTQETTYEYGVVAGVDTSHTDSLINSNDLIKRVTYPDSTTIEYAWNRLGELRSVVDQNGTLHWYRLDNAGRVLTDEIQIAQGSLIDDTIRKIAATYDALGRRARIESLDASQLVSNAVELTYTPFGHLESVYQNPKGAVTYDQITGEPTGDTRRVKYAYTNTGVGPGGMSEQGNTSRLLSMLYPDGNSLTYGYGSTNTSNDRISRLVSMRFSGDAFDTARYEYVGLDIFAVVDYLEPDIQLDRTVDDAGYRRYGAYANGTEGLYPGWDRFGRLAQQSWVDGDLHEDTSHTGYPTRPHVVHEKYGYDKVGNVLWAYDARPGASIANRDYEFDYDDLNRLTDVRRGYYDGGQQQWSHGVGGQAFELDILANQTSVKTDFSGDGDFDDTGSTGDRVETREHNEINQIAERTLEEDPVHGYQPSLPFVYDDAGNMRESTMDGGSANRVYTHDAWNRLVRVEVEVSSQTYTLAEYEYNGLSWRTIKRADTDTVPDDELDEVRVMYYDAQWRLIEEEVDDDAVDPYDEVPDRRLQYVWGIRALDDIIMHRIDRDLDDAYDTQLYHLTDIQFTTNAIVDEQGRVVERVQYDAFGEARHHYNGDMDADGDVDGNDQSIASGAGGKNIWQTGYLVEADANRDGQISGADQSHVTSLYQVIGGMPVVALSPGEISDPYLVDNQIGWSGYVFNREVDLYTVRHRHYSPAFGRWIEQDPAGYIDSMNLYGYGYGSPVGVMDPSGLSIFGDVQDAKENDRKTDCMRREACRLAMQRCANGEMSAEWCRKKKELCDSYFDGTFDEDGYWGEVVDGFLDGLQDGVVLAADNVVGLVGLDIAAADRIREEWGHLAEYRWGDRASKIGAFFLGMAAQEYMFGGLCYIIKGACFVEGTQVATIDGSKAIEDIEVGDLVLSWDEETGEQSYQPVTETFVRYAPQLVHLTYRRVETTAEPTPHTQKGTTREWRGGGSNSSESSDEGDDDDESDPDSVEANAATSTLIGTPEHPFWCVNEHRWIGMGALRKGDRLLLADGAEAEVVTVNIEIAASGSPGFNVYNFEVGGSHTFLIASNRFDEYVLVHNAGGPCGIVTHTVYRAFNSAGDVVYIGRSINMARRIAEHGSKFVRIAPIRSGLTLRQARATEQVLINYYGKGALANKINSIALGKWITEYSDDALEAVNWLIKNYP